MAKKVKYFRNKSNTGWLRYLLSDKPFSTKKGASNCAKGLRNIGVKARVIQDEKTKKWLCYGKP